MHAASDNEVYPQASAFRSRPTTLFGAEAQTRGRLGASPAPVSAKADNSIRAPTLSIVANVFVLTKRPRGFARLIQLAPAAAPIGGQLRCPLADPKFFALLAASPRAGRIPVPLPDAGIHPDPDLPPALFRPPLAPRPLPPVWPPLRQIDLTRICSRRPARSRHPRLDGPPGQGHLPCLAHDPACRWAVWRWREANPCPDASHVT